MSPTLLPNGLNDLLPDESWQLENVRRTLLDGFFEQGYGMVTPPLLSYADAVEQDEQKQLAFIIGDPESQKNLKLRNDFTPAIGRIACDRLGYAPRPLRLCYAGEVVHTRGTQLRPERQFMQLGAEIIGHDPLESAVEIIKLAVDGLAGIKCDKIVIDITLPDFVNTIMNNIASSDKQLKSQAMSFIEMRDMAGLRNLKDDRFDLIIAAYEQAGPISVSDKGSLPLAELLDQMDKELSSQVILFHQILHRLAEEKIACCFNFDPLEVRDFNYQHGVALTIFSEGARGELGRGGGYYLANGEYAFGFSLFSDSLLRARDVTIR